MNVPRGIRYCSPGDISGYGQAAIANVRALVNAGIRVYWTPLDWTTERMRAGSWSVLPDGRVRPLLSQGGTSGHLSDVRALIGMTCAPIVYDTVIAHSPPEFWPYGFEHGKRNIGCTAWEADRMPAHWLPLMRQADRIVVPSTQNRDAFVRGGLDRPVAVVPHIRRHRWCEFGRDEIAAARADFGIPAHHRVFYTIATWTARKALASLIEAFANAFSADEPVTLLIKTEAYGDGAAPLYPATPVRELAARTTQAISAALGRPVPHLLLLDDPLDGDDLDLIHAIGDVYVSLTHGEGWGLGAFEAATLGKLVVMTAWGGHTDYLGSDWPGAVPYQMVAVPLMPPQFPSYFPSQRWAQADVGAAAALLRRTYADPEPVRAYARGIRERIIERYAEPVIAAQWLDLLDA